MAHAVSTKVKATGKKVAITPKYKKGDTVKWSSQAGGSTRTKQGTIVAVLRKKVDYTRFCNLPQKFFIDGLMSIDYGTRSSCRARVVRTSDWSMSHLVEDFFTLRFRASEGMQRDEVHYLISVPTPSGKGNPRLYHPRSDQKFELVSLNLN